MLSRKDKAIFWLYIASIPLFFGFSSTCYAWHFETHKQMTYEALISLAGKEKAATIAESSVAPDLWLSPKLRSSSDKPQYNYGHRITEFMLPEGPLEGLDRPGAEKGAAYWVHRARQAYEENPNSKEWQCYLGYACHFLADALCPPHCTEHRRYNRAQVSHTEFENTYKTKQHIFISSLPKVKQENFSDSTEIENWITKQARMIRGMGPPEKEKYSSLLKYYDDTEISKITQIIGAGIKGLYSFVVPEGVAGVASAVKWTRTFGGKGDDEGKYVQQTSDGGYILVGYTDSHSSDNTDVWLIKTDAKGNKLWERKFNRSKCDIGYSGQQTSDGGYILASTTGPGGENPSDILLIKTDTKGNKLWEKVFKRSWSWGASVQQTRDGGYIILTTAGYGEGVGGDDAWLIKTDARGNKLWEKTFDISRWERCTSVQQTSDGGYILVGYTDSYGSGNTDVWLIKTDAKGNKVWDRKLGGKGNDEGNSVQQTSDGGYILVGGTTSYGSGNMDVWLIKTDAEGKTLQGKISRGRGQ